MEIAILGTGNVGGTLGAAWTARGHRIIYGTRDPNSPKIAALLSATGPKSRAAPIGEAAAAAPLVVLAVPWVGAEQTLRAAGNLAGKILIDTTNPLAASTDWLQKGLVLGHTTSAGEQVAAWTPGAHVVKAFNMTGVPNMANPVYPIDHIKTPASMFICGDENSAKQTTKELSDELGFETFDAGPLKTARLLEPLAMLWMHLAIEQGWGTSFAFKILPR